MESVNFQKSRVFLLMNTVVYNVLHMELLVCC